MRSVVVVLPASMCAMMPMLRTFVRSVSTSCATGVFLLYDRGMRGLGHSPRISGLLPAVVREGAVRLGHLVGVFAALDRGTEAVRGIQDLVLQTLGHRLLTTALRVADEPAECQRVGAARLDLDRHLVGRAADATALDLEGRAHVVERLLERGDSVLAVLGLDALQGGVDDRLGERLLAVDEDLVDELADDRRAVYRVVDDRTLRGGTLTRHLTQPFFAP